MESERDTLRLCLDRMLRATTQGTRIHGVKLLDVDRFRVVNQVVGFDGGDAYLGAFRELLSGAMLEGDRLFYLGEDCFAILCPYRSLKELHEESEQLLSSLNGRRFDINDTSLELFVSIGVAQTEETDRDWEAAMLRAERGLFQAKANGGACVRAELTRDGEPCQLPQQTSFIEHLHHAFLHDGFSLSYRALADTDFVLADVLLKIAGEDVPIADLRAELGGMDLLLTMDRWVLGKLAENQELTKKTLIRLSQTSVRAEQFMRFLRRLLAADPGLASKLWFAVSEREFAGERTQLQRFLEDLRDMNCHAVLLDMGASADSLGNLKQLPVATVSPFPHALCYETEVRDSVLQALRMVAEAAGKDFIASPFSL